ncbi:winged helix-turn-helix transcriptional regulator [Kordiimonas gwangyangensis]|uniref:winged helix-turn-helix transcriptional regulator n=1 Tax=Kordiimonas gwangyangensis TaxID=288022 RepID=UPI000366C5F7|nr:helix-turn-helix domain-containing protein [Kordiimonas gwangyangensis]
MPKGTSKTPLPGRPTKSSRTGRPIMAALDLLGRRWTLRIIWELRDGAVGFRDLQARCENMSPSVLSTRLGELATAKVVAADDDRRWALTDHGEKLIKSLGPLNKWAEDWRVLIEQSE